MQSPPSPHLPSFILRFQRTMSRTSKYDNISMASDTLENEDLINVRQTMTGVIRFTNVRVIRDGAIIDDDIWINNGKIIDPQQNFWSASRENEFTAAHTIDCSGLIAAPGFIEIQINGAYGVDFSTMTLDNFEEGLSIVSRGIIRQGVTAYCPTIVTSTEDYYQKIIPKIKYSVGNAVRGATVLGTHLEGPFMSLFKSGAHKKEYIADPNDGFPSLTNRYGNLENVKLVTIAPELDGALPAIRGLVEHGITVSIGHSCASFSESERAVAAGARSITHLFNAMTAFHHRDPGICGLLGRTEDVNRDLFYGIIADGIHTHPASISMAYRSHPSGAILVTDAMQATGLKDGTYCIGDMEVSIARGRATLTGTNTLAGSVATMDECVRNFRTFTGCSIVEAIDTATIHPARLLNLVNKGRLNAGCDADIVFLDDNLHVRAVYVAGQLAYQAGCDKSFTYIKKNSGFYLKPLQNTSTTDRDFGMAKPLHNDDEMVPSSGINEIRAECHDDSFHMLYGTVRRAANRWTSVALGSPVSNDGDDDAMFASKMLRGYSQNSDTAADIPTTDLRKRRRLSQK